MGAVKTSVRFEEPEITMEQLIEDLGEDTADEFLQGEDNKWEKWDWCYNISKNILGYGDDGYDWSNNGDEWGTVESYEIKPDGYIELRVKIETEE